MNNDKRLEIIFNHIKNGVEFISTDNVFIDETVRIGKHTRVFPDQYIRGNTVIGNSCVLDTGNVIEDSIVGNGVTIIKSVLRNAKIGDKTTVGPFANVHTNADVGKECRVGNFVEIKNATVGQRVKARFQTASGSAIMLILELVLLFLVFMATIALVQAVRKVPVQYAKRIVGNKQYGGVRQYIPLKMNAANVMPIIFAQALMFIPALFSGTAFAAAFSSMTGFWYNFTLAVLVIAFTYFYTAIIINPQMMADDMKRNGGFIPGVKPGKQTVNYIDTIMTRITLPGSFFLAIVAILPALAMKFLGIQQAFAYFYGGTSLLIMVGVVLDTLKQIESYLLMRHYDGLMKTGRIQGRH